MTEPGEACSLLGEVVPDAPGVPAASRGCTLRRAAGLKLSQLGRRDAEAGPRGRAPQPGGRHSLVVADAWPPSPFSLLQKGDSSSPEFVKGGFPTLRKYYRWPRESHLLHNPQPLGTLGECISLNLFSNSLELPPMSPGEARTFRTAARSGTRRVVQC